MNSELRSERKRLAEAEFNSYSPENFPGSAGWRKNKIAKDALAVFDLAHPDIVAELKAEREATQKAKYDSLSDFAKMGG